MPLPKGHRRASTAKVKKIVRRPVTYTQKEIIGLKKAKTKLEEKRDRLKIEIKKSERKYGAKSDETSIKMMEYLATIQDILANEHYLGFIEGQKLAFKLTREKDRKKQHDILDEIRKLQSDLDNIEKRSKQNYIELERLIKARLKKH